MDVPLLRRAYDREAARYDERFLAQQRPKFAALAQAVSPPSPGGRVLDLGGGTGLLASALAAHDSAWISARFVVADLSTGMLRHAAARLAQAVAADARRLPFRRGAFARVFCVTGLVDAADVERALPSIVRVLAPGGLFALSLRPGAVPEALEALTKALPLSLLHAGEAGGDRWFAWARQ